MSLTDSYGNIPLSNIIRYLRLTGWEHRSDFPNKKLIVFDGPKDMNEERIQVVLPSNDNFRDYPVRLQEVLYSLNEIEERSVASIVRDIRSPNVDRLQVRILSDISKDGTLPFSYAATLVTGLKDFLIAAACVEENPQPFYRRASKIGTDYANSCRFGQTNVGSFIINIESLVPSVPVKQLSLLTTDETEHFNRRVFKRIQRGLSFVRKSIDDGDASPMMDYKNGLNANMCEALLALKADQLNIDFEYSVKWSLGVPKPNNIPKTVKIEQIGFEYLESAAKILRDSDESTRRKIVGKVVRLSAADLDQDSATKTITISAEVNNKNIKINVPLEKVHYRIACDAHRDGKEVQIEGVLERVGNRWELMAPENFNVRTN